MPRHRQRPPPQHQPDLGVRLASQCLKLVDAGHGGPCNFKLNLSLSESDRFRLVLNIASSSFFTQQNGRLAVCTLIQRQPTWRRLRSPTYKELGVTVQTCGRHHRATRPKSEWPWYLPYSALVQISQHCRSESRNEDAMVMPCYILSSRDDYW